MKSKTKCKKKGQVNMTETIAVLFIFFVLIMFGIIFYYKYQQVAFVEKQEELLGARAIETTAKVLFMPEILCSKGEAEPEDNCLDLLKLRSLNETFKKYLEDYYFDIFSYGKIYVQEVYPGNSTWILYDKFKQDATKEEPTFFVVTLRDEIPGEREPSYSYGYLTVVVYS
ncbi:MAG: hypothetical protein ABIG52_00955 [Nanoarchaeota archaeon]|nr:hypothetical protein [Nanoarchaeota archaeon]MBU1644685.1 hypothetical protein [Nanoarchaeota archaeon]